MNSTIQELEEALREAQRESVGEYDAGARLLAAAGAALGALRLAPSMESSVKYVGEFSNGALTVKYGVQTFEELTAIRTMEGQ